jgi:D-beta-D-heptose 7-phosphate kinase/D-beta-D-heptose 1-phosphate adenosyltransferase
MQIVYTYGVFDILHPGHIKLLKNARSLGDFLIVGIVSDDVIHKTKGKERPINNEVMRFQVVEELSCVDMVIYQYESDPTTILSMLKKYGFNITTVVHGDDFFPLKNITLVEKMGITIKHFPYTKGYSTTNIINKIKSMGETK